MTKSPSPPKNDVSLDILNEFINYLQRIFKIGIYYPTGHAILDKATERFMELLIQVAGEDRTVTFHVFNNTIILDGVELDRDLPFVRDLTSLFTALGVTAITLDRQISLKEIHDFVRKLTAIKGRVQNVKHFTQIDVTGLPHSVTIEQKEFITRKETPRSSGADDSSDNLDSFVNALSNVGLTQEEIRQCRELLEDLPNHLPQGDIDIGELPSASWDDVARLLARVIKGESIVGKERPSEPSSHSSINALATILKKLGLETGDKQSRDAINLLVSIIKKPDSPVAETAVKGERKARKSFPDKPVVSIAQIQEFASKHKLNHKIIAKIPQSPYDNEMLSILMQLAHFNQPLRNQLRMQQLLRDILSSRLSEKTWKILSCALHSIARQGKLSRISAAIRLLTEPIRRSSHGNTLHLFHLTLQLCGDAERRLLWPYVVNELLVVGSSRDKLIYHNLCQYAARFTQDEMKEALPLLQTLDAFQETRIASDIFHAISPACYPLFAFLLNTEIERYIGERVAGGLRRTPRDWLIRGVAPLLDLSQQEHKLFLYSYLRQAAQKKISDPLKNLAARIITVSLPLLSQEKRAEQWVENSIAAMAQLPGATVEELLNQIAGGKKLLFLPDWPAPCRAAAEKALAVRKERY